MNALNIEQKFYGRKPVLELLKRRVLDLKEGYRQNVAIVGNMYVGKSSLIKNFMTNLDDHEVTVVYLDFENRDFEYFLSKFVASLLYNFAKNNNLPLQDDVRLLMETTRPRIPTTIQVVERIQGDFAAGRWNDCFLGLMALPEIFTNETGQFCVLIFDEFQNIEDFAIADIFMKVGKKIMTQKRCLYFVVSSYPDRARKILSEKLSLLFGNFEMVDLEPFSPHTAQQFIDGYLADLRIGGELRNFLADFTAGYPLYLMLICRELTGLSAMHRQKEIFLPILSQAVENTIFDKWGEISRHFELVVKDLSSGKANRFTMAVLMTIANGRHRLDDIMMVLDTKKTPLVQRLNRLLEMGVIVKNGNFYYFKDKLFKYWTKYIYQRRLKDIELSPDKQRRQFKEEFNRAVENYKNYSRKEFPLRIVELLHCFDNEALQLNGRRYKLPLFESIELSKIKNETGTSMDVIRARAGSNDWLIATKKENFVEGDLNTVLSESRREGRLQHCLMISLAEMDENARLKALQERFWVWSENELNTLLTLFDKPFIS